MTLGPQRSPTERLTALIEQVEQLADNGVLNPGQANSLIVKLEAAIASIEHGNIHTAQNQLIAFANEAEALIPKQLSEERGRPLIIEANAIWDQLNGQ